MNIPASIATPTQQLPEPPLLKPNNYYSIRRHNSSNHKSTNSLDPTFSWTSSIARHCRSGHLAAAAAEFTRMRVAGVEPNNITFVTLLSGCATFPFKSVGYGTSIHAFVRKLGFDRNDVKVGTAVVDMYSKCGLVDLARLCFDEMNVKSKVSWNTMIDGYMRNGELESAVQLFDEMSNRDVISFTALINGFVKKGHFDIALEWFQEMQLSGIQPDYVAIIAILSACANLGAIGLGLWINRFVMTENLKDNIRIHNSLIDMYSKCGCIEFARQVFENMPKRNLVSWNSIIAGFALNGNPHEALKYFNAMKNDRIEPDGMSFTGALTACSHAGLINEGLKLFKTMKKEYKITPRIEHYGCIVDLYSRAGRLNEALNILQNMPMKPNEVVVGSLLAACRTHGDVSLAERLMNYIAKLDPGGDSNYVLLSNIYAADSSWKSASKVRREMKARGIQKKPGVSSIEIECTVHEFKSGDKFHADAEGIYEMLESLSCELGIYGYIPGNMESEIYEYD